MKLKKFQNKTVKNILSVLAILVFGFILLNLAFLFAALFQGAIITILKLFLSENVLMEYRWLSPVIHLLFVVVIGLISWLVFRSKLKVLLKAIYMVVPLAVVFVTIGMFLYPWQIAVFSVSILFFIGVLYYFYRTKQSWLYYFTLIFISLLMLIVSILGVEI